MKTAKITVAVLLTLGLSTSAMAGMGKCGGSSMMGQGKMSGDFATQKAMMQKHLTEMKSCVDAAESSEALQQCRQKMMEKSGMMQKQEMMEKKQQMMQKGKSMKCGAGKCGGS